ncbi:TetR/AcrR family transcriptional regulator [Sphaerisporangium sp. TRM90804]|uniref:TetR/AcrR family transcriptional regulator n=1 Tax=Sphaerisporangium sp. TRM90804 TaxID=3031113 RepID=UPI0024477F81|nr:TetR/AcrR family transcriptional regulator [Sphaerisporangium sp. TRM90804]MDH2423985.1 TetR/AcrR family transcriptional regulator [Sphaerisporangium sp. TRM90804]
MPRPRSEDRRDAILRAATRVIASQGLGAATAAIAREADISNGSLFTYFDTKAKLLNELYVALKAEMAAAATPDLRAGDGPREQVCQMWTQWWRWATANPDKRRALAQLQVADDITADSHRAASFAFSSIADLLERSRANGPMQNVPLGYVLTLVNAIAEATIDEMIREPAEAEARSRVASDAIWRVLAGSAAPPTA